MDTVWEAHATLGGNHPDNTGRQQIHERQPAVLRDACFLFFLTCRYAPGQDVRKNVSTNTKCKPPRSVYNFCLKKILFCSAQWHVRTELRTNHRGFRLEPVPFPEQYWVLWAQELHSCMHFCVCAVFFFFFLAVSTTSCTVLGDLEGKCLANILQLFSCNSLSSKFSRLLEVYSLSVPQIVWTFWAHSNFDNANEFGVNLGKR